MNSRVAKVRGLLAAGVITASLGAMHCAAGAPAAPSPPPSEDIRDIRGPKFIPPGWLLPAIAGGGALLALGAYGIWRRRQRRRSRKLLPYEIALQQLEDIRALMQPATAQQFCVAASDIVRGYIQQRFDVTVTRLTTEEFLRDLLDSSHKSLARHRRLLGDFLHQCDYVKFAGASLTLQTMEALRQSARAFVLETSAPEEKNTEAHDSLSSA
jgi:hypothetical protein